MAKKRDKKLDHKVSQLAKNNAHLHAAEEQSKITAQGGDSVNNTAGFVNLAWINGELNEAFMFPRNFAVTIEHMCGNLFLAKPLSSRMGKLEMMNWQFTYKNKDLIHSPQHRFVLEFLKEQIENYGGMHHFIKQNVLTAIKYGISVFAPTVSVQKRVFRDGDIEEVLELGCIDNIFWYHPASLYRIYMDKEDLNRVGSVEFWQPEKATVSFEYAKEDRQFSQKYSSDLSYYEQNKRKEGKPITRTLDNGGKIVLSNIDVAISAGGVVSYNTEGSNPVGKSYIYPLYPLYLLSHYTMESTIKTMSTTGFHSLIATPINPDSIMDPAGSLAQLQQAYKEAQENGGGLISSNTHNISNLPVNDIKDIPTMLESIFTLSSRSFGESVDALGIDGGTRGVSDAFMKNLEPELLLDARQLSRGVNSTFLKYYIDMNFGHWIRSGYLEQYPVLDVDLGEVENVTNNSHNTEKIVVTQDQQKGKENTSPKENEEIKASQSFSEKTNNNNNIIKRKPNNIIEEIILDIEDIEKTFIQVEKDLVNKLNEIIRSKFSTILRSTQGNPKKINQALEKEIEFIKKELLNSLEYNAKELLRMNVSEYLRGTQYIGIQEDIHEMGNKTLQKYTKKSKERIEIISYDLINKLASDTTSFLKTKGSMPIKTLLNRAIIAFTLYTQHNYMKLARDMMFTANDDIAMILAQELVHSSKEIILVRTGILEGACSPCTEMSGTVYHIDEFGSPYNTEGKPFRELPDSECLGMVHGKGVCRCKWFIAPAVLEKFIKSKNK